MIKFFRKIRYQLLQKNKTGKYLKYALGEIVLVMIGILLAIQVNNWNENRKLKNRETVVLENIQSDLLASKDELDKCSNSLISKNRQTETLIYHFENEETYHDSLDKAISSFIYFPSPYLTYTTYESLKSSGTDLISNHEILRLLTEIYEYDFSVLIKDQDRMAWEALSNIHLPFYAKNIELNTSGPGGKPNDYESLKNNPEFTNILKLTFKQRNALQSALDKSSKKIESLLDMISQEIELNK